MQIVYRAIELEYQPDAMNTSYGTMHKVTGVTYGL